jgi:hypothetical protein
VQLKAREHLVIEYRSVSEARGEIIKRMKGKPYLDFSALDFNADDFLMLANELPRVGIERKLQSTDVKLVDAIHPEFISKVYRIHGKACYWKCDLFVILVDKIDGSHISVRVVPAFPMASVGRVFNIHTFTFIRKWQPVTGAESVKWTPKVGQRGTDLLNKKGTVTHVQKTTTA